MCPLCKLDRITKWYEDNVTFAILDCCTCGVPMVVLKRHTTKPTDDEMQVMLAAASTFKGKLDFNRRSIPDHFHFHIR